MYQVEITLIAKAMKSLVAPITAGHTAEETFPHIFLSEEGQAQQAELCNKARQSLSEEHPEVTGM